MIKRKILSTLAVLILILAMVVFGGCGGQKNAPDEQKPSNAGNQSQSSEKQDADKTMPEQMTKIKVAVVTKGISRLPFEIGEEKGIFKKYNLEPEFVSVKGGPNALRGLQTGDFQFAAMLVDPVITGVPEGADVKVIGALTNKSSYSFYTSPDIKTAADLKGKAAAVMSAAHGTDYIMRWFLKEKGLEPEKDVKIIYAGGVTARLEALKNNQAQITLLTPPSDQVAAKSGFKLLGLLRDELKEYNQDVIPANGKMLRENPEVARAFMAAIADSIAFIKDEGNREEVSEIGMRRLKAKKDDFVIGLDFTLPAFGDKGKVNVKGLEYSIKFLKESGSLTKDVKVSEFVDEGYYKP